MTDNAQTRTARVEEIVMSEEKEFSFREYCFEDYIALGFFWVLAVVVFAQFFTRYFMSKSPIWTEEVARYLLICVTFLGSSMGVRRNSHIFVEFFYRFIPKKAGRFLVTVVDILRILYFLAGTRLAFILIPQMKTHALSSIPLPLSYIYGVVLAGFILMSFRSIQLAWLHWRDKFLPAV
jgi:TRAP-type C4-dicarboxylate transport system permease small subunit